MRAAPDHWEARFGYGHVECNVQIIPRLVLPWSAHLPPHLIQVKLLIPPGELIGTSAWRGFFFPHLVLVSRKMWWYMAARHV